MGSYPRIRYPTKVIDELAKIKAAAKVKTSAAPQKSVLPTKPQYLTQFPWYVAIISLLAAIALVYQVATIPVIALLLGAGIGASLKYAIDRHRWKKQIETIKQRDRTVIAIPPAAIIYPNWKSAIDLQTSSTISQAQIGVSEQFFLAKIQQFFSMASFGHKHPYPGRDEKYWYSSDLEIILQGIGIQIEIDEPYEGKSKSPHHCSDDSKDAKRDTFFLERDWIIIRFAECQVVQEPIACCSLIARVIADLTGDRKYLTAILSQRSSSHGNQQVVTKIPTWTRKEAKLMADQNFRIQYLSAAGLWNQKKS
jgi:hypothetical protein